MCAEILRWNHNENSSDVTLFEFILVLLLFLGKIKKSKQIKPFHLHANIMITFFEKKGSKFRVK